MLLIAPELVWLVVMRVTRSILSTLVFSPAGNWKEKSKRAVGAFRAFPLAGSVGQKKAQTLY